MPAILRILLPKSFASIVIIRPYAVYDRVGVRTTRSPPCPMAGTSTVCNTYAMSAGVCMDRPSGLLRNINDTASSCWLHTVWSQVCITPHNLLASYMCSYRPLYCPGFLVVLDWSGRMVTHGNGPACEE